MKRHLTQSISVIVLSVGIAACSAKTTPIGATGPQTQQAPADNVQGPALDGEWLSGCSPTMVLSGDAFVDGAVIINITIAGRDVTRVTQTFADKTCANKTKTVEQKGTFRYLEKTDVEDFRVEYRFDIGNGAFALPQELIRLNGAELFISNFGVSPSIKLTRPGSSPTPETRSPYDVAAGASCRASWNAKSTRYAVCSNQGNYSFLDFGGTDWKNLRDLKVEVKNLRGDLIGTYHVVSASGRVETLADLTLVSERRDSIEITGARLSPSGGGRPTFGYVVIGGNSGDCRPLVTGTPVSCYDDFRRGTRYSDTIPVSMFGFTVGQTVRVGDCNLRAKTTDPLSPIAAFQVEGTAPCRLNGENLNPGTEIKFNLQDERNYPFLAIRTN